MGVTRFVQRSGSPAERMAGFMAHLRHNGFCVGVGETAAALEAMHHVEICEADQVRLALKAVCTGSYQEHERFDDLFDAYWRNRGRERQRSAQPANTVKPKHQRSSARSQLPQKSASGQGVVDESDGGGDAEQRGLGRLIGSKLRNLSRVDLRELVTKQDIADAELVAERLARAIRYRRSRRHRNAKKGARLDLRRMARASIAYGGEPMRICRKARRDRPAKLVALCDVSGSMTLYARVFLSFLKGLMSAQLSSDAYLFHTKLVRITDALRDGDTLRAVGRLSLLADGFGGGTKIASNLVRFNRTYAKKFVNGRTIVIILSDGYDTDPPVMIGDALARLKKRGCRIIWLNPLKGWRDYEPVARGMAAALPYLDYFGAANTLESLAALEPELARI